MGEVTIEQLSERVIALERRVHALEGVSIPAAVAPAFSTPPPPVVVPPPVHRVERDEEFFLGARVLPRVGAAVLLLGIAYLVSLAVSAGLIGPWGLFGGACLLSAGFVVVGQRLRNEREEFGDVLTGIGSGGLYVTFAAGLVAQNLYPGETLVALYLALSALNMAYASWRGKVAFFAIGVLGGYGAALLPILERSLVLSATLQLVVLVVGAAIAARKGWITGSIGLFAVGIVAALPLAFGPEEVRPYGVFLLYAAAAGGVLGSLQKTNDAADLIFGDGYGALAPVSAFLAFLSTPGLSGSAHLLIGLSVLAIEGRFAATSEKRKAIWTGTAIAAVGIVPWGLAPTTSLFAYPAVAAALLLVSIRAGRAIRDLSAVSLLGAALRYLQLEYVADSGKLPIGTEAPFLAIMTACLFGAAATNRRREGEPVGIGLAVIVLSRLEYLGLSLGLGLGGSEAGTVTLILTCSLLLAFGFVRNQRALRYSSFVGFALTGLKVLCVDLVAAPPVVRVFLLMALGGTMVAGGYGYVRREHKPAGGSGE